MSEITTDILIVGGGTGGCAAALAAADMGLRVILTEETDWIGGQLTSQAVPPDEHAWIERFGCTQRYRRFRERVRSYYRENYPLLPQARFAPFLNPGHGSVSALCCEPRVALFALESMMAYRRARGDLEVRLRRKPVAAETDGEIVRAVSLRNLETGGTEIISAAYVLDATELGDLLPLAGVEYVTGFEGRGETGEPHAPDAARPDDIQGLTWCFPVALDPVGDHTISRPAMYSFWRDYVPPLQPLPWPGPMLSWTYSKPHTLQPIKGGIEGREGEYNLWRYRRIICTSHYPEGVMPHEATVVNWPQNDYFLRSIIDRPELEVEKALYEARQLSLSLLYWMQTEAPRSDGGTGYPGLYLRPDLTGTSDGLAKYPYIRESRRIKAIFTVTEGHVGESARMEMGYDRAESFHDSVGIGFYRIDLHPGTGGDNYIDIGSLPFQIPLGALLPVRMRNLIPAGKNIGTTHIANGCYRLHPVEWNAGESAGLLAAFSLLKKICPRQVREDGYLLHEFQDLLYNQGIELAWPQG